MSIEIFTIISCSFAIGMIFGTTVGYNSCSKNLERVIKASIRQNEELFEVLKELKK